MSNVSFTRSALETDSATSPVPIVRLRHLEVCEQRAELDAQHVQLLQARVTELEAALQRQESRGEKTAETLTQHAATIGAKETIIHKLEYTVAMLEASIAGSDAKHKQACESHAAAGAKLEAQVAELKLENAALKAQAASKLSEIHAAVTSLQTLEIFPTRAVDGRRFAAWHNGPVPPVPPPLHLSSVAVQPLTWDRAWAAVFANSGEYKIHVDAASFARMIITSRTKLPAAAIITLRSAAPLPRRPISRPDGHAASTTDQQPLPAYRVVIEAYSGGGNACRLGFIPSHHAGAVAGPNAVTAIPADHAIWNYGGWCIAVSNSGGGVVEIPELTGWVVLPAVTGAGGALAPEIVSFARAMGHSAYATTVVVPPVPEGGAVEFALDYTADTCRLAFYTPTAVAGGFLEPPYAKMELGFVATAANPANQIPKRRVPTATAADVELYPAWDPCGCGAAVRFVSA